MFPPLLFGLLMFGLSMFGLWMFGLWMFGLSLFGLSMFGLSMFGLLMIAQVRFVKSGPNPLTFFRVIEFTKLSLLRFSLTWSLTKANISLTFDDPKRNEVPDIKKQYHWPGLRKYVYWNDKWSTYRYLKPWRT